MYINHKYLWQTIYKANKRVNIIVRIIMILLMQG